MKQAVESWLAYERDATPGVHPLEGLQVHGRHNKHLVCYNLSVSFNTIISLYKSYSLICLLGRMVTS